MSNLDIKSVTAASNKATAQQSFPEHFTPLFSTQRTYIRNSEGFQLSPGTFEHDTTRIYGEISPNTFLHIEKCWVRPGSREAARQRQCSMQRLSEISEFGFGF